jgi:hypothetical protein
MNASNVSRAAAIVGSTSKIDDATVILLIMIIPTLVIYAACYCGVYVREYIISCTIIPTVSQPAEQLNTCANADAISPVTCTTALHPFSNRREYAVEGHHGERDA